MERRLVHVRATAEFIYDLDEAGMAELLSTPEDCLDDVQSMIASDELDLSSYTFECWTA